MADCSKKAKGKVAGRIPHDRRVPSIKTAINAAVASEFLELINTSQVQAVIDQWVASGKVVADVIDGRTVYYVPN